MWFECAPKTCVRPSRMSRRNSSRLRGVARGVSPPDAPQRMGVASGHPAATLRVVAKLLEQHLDEFAVLALLRAVPDLENLEQRGHLADVVAQVLGMREVVEEVVQDVKKFLLLQIGDELVSVLPQLLEFPVMLLGDVINADVDGMAELGKPGRDFLGDDEVVERPRLIQ